MASARKSLYLEKLKFDQNLFGSFIHKLTTNVRLIFLAVATIVVAGTYSFFTLPREVNPEVKIPLVNVITVLPGADPSNVEELITKKLEKELVNLSGLESLNSSSRESVSIISAEFISSKDPDEALDLVKEKVDSIKGELPDEATEPTVEKLDFNDQPIWTLAVKGNIDRLPLSNIVDELKEKLESTPGIRKVNVSGNEEEEIVVALNQNTLLQYNIPSEMILGVLKANNVNVPAGSLEISNLEYTVSLDNEFSSIEQIRALPIQVGASSLPLGEVANIFYRTKDTSSLATFFDESEKRQPAVELQIFKAEDETIQGAVSKSKSLLEEELSQFPELGFISIIDASQEVSESFSDLQSNFTSTILLVFFILFMFLGLKQASIASLSIPLTFLSAFSIMTLTGISMNFLSLFSLLLALGLVVDDAIVIVQAMSRYSTKFPPVKAGLMVFRDFVVPIWTTTLTTIWAFVPLLLSTGLIGEFIKSIPIVVTATLMSSTTIAVLINIPLTVVFAQLNLPKRIKVFLWLLLALLTIAAVFLISTGSPLMPVVAISFVITLVLAYLSKVSLKQAINREAKKRGASFEFLNKIWNWVCKQCIETGFVDFSKVSKWYEQFLLETLKDKKKRIRVYMVTGIFLITSVIFLATGLLKSEFFPKVDNVNLFLNLEAPPGTPVESTQQIIIEAENSISDIEEIKTIFSKTGSNIDLFQGGNSGTHLGSISLVLVDKEERKRSSFEVSDEIRERLKFFNLADATLIETTGGPPTGADFQTNINGPDLIELETISNDFIEILEEIEGAINIESSLKLSSGKVQVNLNAKELQERGLSAIQVGSWLRTAVTGIEASEILIDEKDQDITITLDDDLRTLGRIQSLPLPTQRGFYTLDEVATFTLENSPTVINREDGERTVRVSAAVSGVSSQELLSQFQSRVKDYQLPEGYNWNVGGENQENVESTKSIIQAMGISIILILITMVLQLESFRKSAIVLSVIPLAIAGVFFNFTILQIPLSFPALIGILALFGIVVNNSIMLVEKINRNFDEGFPFYKAIADACASRIEPIFLTSVTTSIGLLPISISNPLWRGLGGSIIAGLSVSGLLILILLPSLYVEVFKPKKM